MAYETICFVPPIKLILIFNIKPCPDSTIMNKLLLLLLFSCTTAFTYGQTDSLSQEEMRLLDSMFQNDEFIKLMMADKAYSLVDLSIGIGNGIFSLNNNALNAGQAQTSKIYYTPSAGYHHKTGLGVTVSGFFAADKGNLKMYRYAISPSYTYSNKNFTAGLSYTRFIEGSAASFELSPFKNDFYTSARYKKSWLQPGIAFGYSFGKQTEYYDTSFWLLNRMVHIRDTITTKLSGLSASLSATHVWNFDKVLGKKDHLQLQPVIMLNAGSQKWDITHSSSFLNRRPVVQNYLKSRYGDGTTSSKFNLQSLGFSAALSYYYGRFYLQPQFYFDYYLPTTTEKRLTSLFAVVAGFIFY